MRQGTKLALGVGFLVGGVFLIRQLTKSAPSKVDVTLLEYQETETPEERQARLLKQERLYNDLKIMQSGGIPVDFSDADLDKIKADLDKFKFDPTKQIRQNLSNVDWTGFNAPRPLDWSHLNT